MSHERFPLSYSRRRWLQVSATFAGGVGLGVSLASPAQARTPLPQGMPKGVDTSPLVYLSPLKADGGLSRCQAEIWFARVNDALYVVTDSKSWRARAAGRGAKARIWVGDVGRWQSSDGAYLQLPAIDLNSGVETDRTTQLEVLGEMGTKYAREWGTWGPRFRNGLADGSRVMLRYRA